MAPCRSFTGPGRPAFFRNGCGPPSRSACDGMGLVWLNLHPGPLRLAGCVTCPFPRAGGACGRCLLPPVGCLSRQGRLIRAPLTWAFPAGLQQLGPEGLSDPFPSLARARPRRAGAGCKQGRPGSDAARPGARETGLQGQRLPAQA